MTMTKTKPTEKQFMQAVVQYARLHNWLCYHPYDSRKSVPGFPDLTMVRSGYLVFAELKRDGKQKLTEHQRAWIENLKLVARNTIYDDHKVKAFTWTPDDWDEIEKTLY